MIYGPHACPHCNGYVSDIGDGLGPKCWNCGRSPESPPSKTQLNAAGIVQDVGLARRLEMAGRRGPKNAREYNPAPLGLKHPLATRRR